MNGIDFIDFRTVFVEAELLLERFPDWIESAPFDCRMFSSLRAAVIRPGLGTISDVLSAGAPVSTAFESDNLEMRLNAERLRDLGCGWFFGSPAEAYEAALDYTRSNAAPFEPSIDLNGIEETAEILIARFASAR